MRRESVLVEAVTSVLLIGGKGRAALALREYSTGDLRALS
jgi:hypothetical protein